MFIVSIAVSVLKFQTCIVSVSYPYQIFRPGKHQYRIGVKKVVSKTSWVDGADGVVSVDGHPEPVT